MTLYTSDMFASASAAGTDWRDTAKTVLEQLQEAQADDAGFNIGFIYMTDNLADDAQSILNLFKSVTNIPHWVGSIGLGICATGVEYADEPAISAMIGRIPEDDFKLFPPVDFNVDPARATLEPWMENSDPMLVVVHGDPQTEEDPALVLQQIEQLTGGFLVGGMTASRAEHLQFSDDIAQGGVSGVAFSDNVRVASTLTQGCAPIGAVHSITGCEDNVITEIDGQPAFTVFSEELKSFAAAQTGKMADNIALSEELFSAESDTESLNELQKLFKGEMHVAFPVSGSDQKDYMVRNVLGLYPDEGCIAVAHQINVGDSIMFVHRDHASVRIDLSRALMALRERVKNEEGVFAPKGALYISCIARIFSQFSDGPGGEMKLVKEILGDIPLTGFYANGEISNHRLYGYTAILVLFL